MNESQPRDGIAVIGLAGRFPKAKSIEELWENLRHGVEGISFFSAEELEEAGVIFPKNNPNYVKARGVLEDADKFDASFFGVNPKEAEIMDPQHRVFLECAWEALESAGYSTEEDTGLTGVFAGMSMNTYLLSNLSSNPELMELVGAYQTMLANDKDYLTTRVSYKLNLKGPSMNIQTACSTSLVAVCVACQQLLNFQCDMALAGGVSICFPQKRGHLYQEGGISSPDGHCRAFDAKGQGTVAGDGVGIVVLKRLQEALDDGDQVYAVIKGFATNNDGAAKIGFTAPSEDGQSEVVALAQSLAGVEPESIRYVVTHGTGTPLGDPIEIAGLTKAFRAGTNAKQFCAIGSIKTSIGHLDAAAGVAGLINAILALHHKQIPSSLHFENPNPKIDFANSPFFVNTRLTEWKPSETPRRAGVSSFGIGGTNAHVVLEEAPAIEPSSRSRSSHLLLISAKTNAALDTATSHLAAHLKAQPEINLADAAYTLQVGRRAFNHRRILVCHEVSDAVDSLQTLDPKQVSSHVTERENPPVVFLFPGQGAQQVNMGLELYQTEPVFKEQVDLCSEILLPHLGFDLRTVLYPSADKTEEASRKLTQTFITQPALFVIEYALAKLWMSWSVQPQSMIGHSIGEYVAACLAGVFSLKDALILVAARGRLMQDLPGGSMLAVRLTEKELQPLLSEELSLAAINSTSLCVVSGPMGSIEALHRQLTEQRIICQPLHTSHAFHSAMMDPIVRTFAGMVAKVHPKAPRIPYVSNVTGNWITEEQTTNPEYWASHLRQPVLFAAGIGTLLKEPDVVFLEVGPGQTLGTLARQHPARSNKQMVLSSLRHAQGQQTDSFTLMNALGHLWLAGVPIDWPHLYTQERRMRLRLPTYPFERQRYWVEAQKPGTSQRTTLPTLAASSTDMKKALPIPDLREVAKSQLFGPDLVLEMLRSLFSLLSGLELDEIDANTTFTEMGFDSLFLTQACQGIEKTFGIKIAFGQLLEKFPTLDLLAAHVHLNIPHDNQPAVSEDGQWVFRPAVAPVPIVSHPDKARSLGTVPLTEPQKEVWFAAQRSDEASCAFNQSNILHLKGRLDVEALRKSLQNLVTRHQSLRTTFAATGEYQHIAPTLAIEVPLVDFSALDEAQRETELEAIYTREASQALDLVNGPLHRFQILRLGEEHHALVWTVHHLVCDGGSIGVLLNELSQLYAGECRGTPATLPASVQFSDYALRKAAAEQSAERIAAEDFWMKQFTTPPQVLELPTDFARPLEKTFRGGWEFKQIRPSLCRSLKKLSARQGCTLFTTLLAGYYVLLHRLTGQEDIVIGIPTADRTSEGSEKLVGHCINFLPVRGAISGEMKFTHYLAHLKKIFFDAFAHQNYTFGTLVQKLDLPRDRSRMPLLSVTFNMVWVRDGLNFPNLEAEIKPNPRSFSNFDFTFNITETDGIFSLDCNYNSDLLSRKTVRRWIGYFEALLEGAAINPEQRLADLPLLSEAERRQIVVEWNKTGADFPRERSVPQLFEAQVERTPDAIAAVCGEQKISYQELNRRANQVAHFLQKAGVKPETPVGLCPERSLELLTGMLGILKAGGAYVPLDVNQPPEEFRFQLEDSGAALVLTQKRVAEQLPRMGARKICLDSDWSQIARHSETNPTQRVEGKDLAYILYAAGTGDSERGVAVEHRSVVALAHWAKSIFTEAELEGVLATSSICSERSVFELFAPLSWGGKVILAGDIAELPDLPARSQVRLIHASSSAVKALLNEGALPDSMQTICLSGEKLSTKLIEQLSRQPSVKKIYKLFGMPEDAVFAALASPMNSGPKNIGRPLANHQIYIVDRHLQPMPPGGTGELLIGGDGLARGYWNLPGLTLERFIANPFSSEPDAKLFRTGVLCRHLSDGSIEFIGRMAEEQRIRGYRIDLGEVEIALSEHPAVRECAAVVQDDSSNEKQIVSYLVLDDSTLTAHDLRVFLRDRLPDYLMPGSFIFLETLPTLPDGKLNREALPAPNSVDADTAEQLQVARTPTQEALAKIWCEVIGLSEISVDDNFFDLGGHSVLVTQIVSRVRKLFHVELSLRTVFESPTIAELSEVLEGLLLQQVNELTEDEAQRLSSRAELIAKE